LSFHTEEHAMKLWLLKPRDNLPENDNPWEPWHKKALGFIVRAEDEAHARHLAHLHAGAENHSAIEPWMDGDYSTCNELTGAGEEGVILCDVVSVTPR
jgi:hypothetical protein